MLDADPSSLSTGRARSTWINVIEQPVQVAGLSTALRIAESNKGSETGCHNFQQIQAFETITLEEQ